MSLRTSTELGRGAGGIGRAHWTVESRAERHQGLLPPAAAEEKATQAYLQTSVWAMHAITAAGPIIGALAELGCQWRLPVPL